MVQSSMGRWVWPVRRHPLGGRDGHGGTTVDPRRRAEIRSVVLTEGIEAHVHHELGADRVIPLQQVEQGVEAARCQRVAGAAGALGRFS
jgi:hypothetical protein